ncbi:MAG: zinc ribbon domain-containing protein [Candidatus Bathyarchaeia archaeon]
MNLYCPKCGAQLPDEAAFCMKCGTSVAAGQSKQAEASTAPVLAPLGATALKCPSCGAPISPKFGEMIITCEYCGTGITLGNDGWKGVQKQTMLPLKFGERDQVVAKIHDLMDRGLLHRHLQESSTLEEMNLSFVPYWIVSVSARTSIVASDMVVQAGEIATTAALFGVMGSAMGGRRGGGGFAGPLLAGAVLGTMMGPGQASAKKTYEMDNNYNFPIVALKALIEHQPRNYQFSLDDRALFDVSKVPKGIKILNGDVGQEAANYQAKTLVDQLQSEKAHAQYHMIQQLHTDVDVADAELLYAPIWFAQYDHKGNKIVLVIDGNSGAVINSIGL